MAGDDQIESVILQIRSDVCVYAEDDDLKVKGKGASSYFTL